MCDCIEKIDELLAPEHALHVTLNLMGGESQPIIALIRRDTWQIERRSKKRQHMLATYCPWCGEKYGRPETATSVEENGDAE